MKILKMSIGSGVMAILLLGNPSPTKAFTLGWAADGFDNPTGLTLSDQTTGLQIGSLVAVGNFGALDDAAVIALGANPTAIWSAFEPWATGAIGDGTFVEGSFEISSGASGEGFFNEQIYLVAFNAPSAASATQVGVFKGPAALAAYGDTWIFPPEDFATKNIVTDALDASHVLIGSYGTLTYYNADWWGGYVNALALIPEPTSAMLVGVSLFGAFLMRRRKA